MKYMAQKIVLPAKFNIFGNQIKYNVSLVGDNVKRMSVPTLKK